MNYIVPVEYELEVALSAENSRKTILSCIGPLNWQRLLSRPSGTLSSIPNGGEGRGEEAPGFRGRIL